MITLNRDGQWHEFLDRYGDAPTNLCWLFWKSVLLPPLLVTAGVMAVIMTVLVLLGMFHAVALLFGVLVPWGFDPFVAIGLCIWLVLIFLALKRALRGSGTAIAHSKPSQVASAAYRGFKDKFCPLVRWE